MNTPVKKAPVKGESTKEPDGSASGYKIEIKPDSVVKALIIITGILVVLNFLAILIWLAGGYDQALGFVPGFYLDREANVPTFFSSLILLFASLLFAFIARDRKKQQEKHVAHWFLLSFIFLYMALDEASSFHEHLILPLRSSLNLSGIFYYAWVVAGGLFLFAFAAFYLKFFFALSALFRKGFFLAGFIYVFGALGMELLGGYYAEKFGLENFTYAFITSVEETMELAGVLILIRYLFLYLQKNTRALAISLPLKK